MSSAALVAARNLAHANSALKAAVALSQEYGIDDGALYDVLDASARDLEKLGELATTASPYLNELVGILESGQATLVQLATVRLQSNQLAHICYALDVYRRADNLARFPVLASQAAALRFIIQSQEAPAEEASAVSNAEATSANATSSPNPGAPAPAPGAASAVSKRTVRAIAGISPSLILLPAAVRLHHATQRAVCKAQKYCRLAWACMHFIVQHMRSP